MLNILHAKISPKNRLLCTYSCFRAWVLLLWIIKINTSVCFYTSNNSTHILLIQ